MAQDFSSHCAHCGAEAYRPGACGSCGRDKWFGTVNGFIVTAPEGLPCMRCDATGRPVSFRLFSRAMTFLFWAALGEAAGYICPQCARIETGKSMLITSAFGWWSVQSWLYLGWRTTYRNWRTLILPPRNPADWGALHLSEMIDPDALGDSEPGDPLDDAPPLEQIERVINEKALFEVLAIEPTDDIVAIRSAYRRQAKRLHPDLQDSSDGLVSDRRMANLNSAWEILRDEELRAAYLWSLSYRRSCGERVRA